MVLLGPWPPDGVSAGTQRFAERRIRGYAHPVGRRVVSTITLLALASMPVVARTRLVCRYTGVEITDCAEQEVPGRPVVQAEGCCHRQATRPLGNLLIHSQQEIAPPALHASAALPMVDRSELSPLVRRPRAAAAPTGPPLFVITRALLL